MKVLKWIFVSVYESTDINMCTRNKEYKFICVYGINEMYVSWEMWSVCVYGMNEMHKQSKNVKCIYLWVEIKGMHVKPKNVKMYV